MNRNLRNLLLASVLLPLAACSSGGSAPGRGAGNADTGVLKIGNPYQIEGRTYYPSHDPEYEEVGVASWYGPGFHGKSTANGERFDQHALTAAHRTLPLPSIVEVTNLENGRTATVTVNDRGPFSKERIIDLSKAAADKLGVIQNGTAQVRVRYLPEESRRNIEQAVASGKLKADTKTLAALGMQEAPPANAPSAPAFQIVSSAYADEPAPYAGSRTVSAEAPLAPVQVNELPSPPVQTTRTAPVSTPISPLTPSPVTVAPTTAQVASSAQKAAGRQSFVQVASFSHPENAHDLAQRLASLGPASVKPVDISGRTWYRVRLGPVASSGAQDMLIAVRDMGLPDARIVTE